MKSFIYLDNNASTFLDPRVKNALVAELEASEGNPSSLHQYGQEVRLRVTKARRLIASFLGIQPQELTFTSGGTEGLNMVIQGFLAEAKGGHVISSDVEHVAVYHPLKFMESKGFQVSYLPAKKWGAITPQQVKEAIRSDTRLIVLMAVNNETGVKTDVASIAKIAHEAKIPFIVDGVCWLGKELFAIPPGVSAMCFSAHKLHGPKGIGAVFIRGSRRCAPFLLGGPQESQKRGGTENVLGIIGFAEAVRILAAELPEASERMMRLRLRLENGLMKELPQVTINGEGPRVANTVNLSFAGVEGESLLMNLDLAGIAVSHGSACSSGALEPSRILLNMGIPSSLANTAIRFSLSRFTTEEEIDRCIDIVTQVVNRLRSLTSA